MNNKLFYRKPNKSGASGTALVIVITMLILLFSLLGSCANSPDDNEAADLKIFTTLFVLYDFSHSIAGDRASVNMLLPAGVDIHTYEPTPQDIILLNQADLFIYNGGSSEAWVDRLLESEEVNPKNTLRMMDFVELREETDSGIIEQDEDHGHVHGLMDEHIWTSPPNAIAMSTAIKDKLIEIDQTNKNIYEDNFNVLQADLNAVHERFLAIVKAGARDFIVVADRFPLIYFTAEYGLNYYAAYEACAAEAEPAPRTVTTLIQLVIEKDVPYIFTIEFSNERLADQISKESGAEKLLFHTVHNLTQKEIDQGITYVGLMLKNADNLEKALADE